MTMPTISRILATTALCLAAVGGGDLLPDRAALLYPQRQQ